MRYICVRACARIRARTIYKGNRRILSTVAWNKTNVLFNICVIEKNIKKNQNFDEKRFTKKYLWIMISKLSKSGCDNPIV